PPPTAHRQLQPRPIRARPRPRLPHHRPRPRRHHRSHRTPPSASIRTPTQPHLRPRMAPRNRPQRPRHLRRLRGAVVAAISVACAATLAPGEPAKKANDCLPSRLTHPPEGATSTLPRGSNSVVECNLAKVDVEGSN